MAASESKRNGEVNGSASSGLSPLKSRQKSVSYPGYTLRQAEDLAKVAFDSGPRNCDQDKVAKAANYSVGGGAFKVLRSTAKQFGLIQIEKNGCLSVTEEWIDVFHHSENLQLTREARRRAMLRPNLYKQIIEAFTGRQLPNPEKLARELHLNQKYGILKEAAGTAARLFLESASYANFLDEKGYLVDEEPSEPRLVNKDLEAEQNQDGVEEEVAEQVLQETPKIQNRSRSQEQSSSLIEVNGPSLEGLERHEITLVNGKKAYLYVPVPLPYGEKDRLKKYLGFISDLILEELPPLSTQKPSDSLEIGF
jgi:hypothetical protein